MKKEQVESLNLGIAPLNNIEILLIESAFAWVNDNTDYDIDVNNDDVLKKLNPQIKLFVLKYFDLMSMPTGISSESIEGLSQSYNTTNKSDLLWQYAYELLGDHVRSQLTFTSAKRKWF